MMGRPLIRYHAIFHVCTRRTKKLNFPEETPRPPDPDIILKLDDMVGRALGKSEEQWLSG